MFFSENGFVYSCTKPSVETKRISWICYKAYEPIGQQKEKRKHKCTSEFKVIHCHRCEKITERKSLQYAHDSYDFPFTGNQPIFSVAHKRKPVQENTDEKYECCAGEYFFPKHGVASSLQFRHHESHGITYGK